ncbi:hypothetical protein SAMN04515674_12161 [Pseudarcicella hirudinis]|uniref:Uncharacterized protein n=1 Tax=Pseudarcicella hirudinis TaxID=1079859 RepID=A0A1I5YTY1_9BACT|nr:hypothetical protein [Pseudarcicella hirudinis]SFQ27183.1 hypothetical protein SAMN04515674_113147 [Pseudarcicella hirudinis]SFQ47570.1 hypothetical protein SAMN04515674_12161 [Pseudarcicella hirudinis]
MSVKAKFQCNSIVEIGHFKDSLAVSFSVVYGTDGENADYSKSTPAGHLTLNVCKGTKGAEFFKRGDYYYLNFEKASQ